MASPAPTLEKMPVGFRFRPTDEELVDHYLRHKLLGDDDSLDQIIAEIDVCKVEPWDLPAFSKVKSDDPEWFFFSPRGLKYTNSKRSNRATKAGYWKATGKDRNIKTRGTNIVIGSKKTLVFYRGRVPHGVKTKWVIHEYQAVTFPVSQRTFVLCRLMEKTEKKAEEGKDALINVEGDPSSVMVSDYNNQASADRIPDVHTPPEVNLESMFPAGECDVPLIQQSPIVAEQDPSFQYLSFPNSSYENENSSMKFPFQATEEEDNVVEAVSFSKEEWHAFVNDFTPSESLTTDTELVSARYANSLDTTSIVCNEQAGSSEFQVMKMVKSSHGALQAGTPPLPSYEVNQEKKDSIFQDDFPEVDTSSVDLTADKHLSICVIARVSSPSPPRRSKTKYHPRLDNLLSQRVSARRAQTHRKVSRRAASQNEVQKENHIKESNKDNRKSQFTSSRKNMESTSNGANRRGSFIFFETPSLSQNPNPRSVYLVNIVIGFSLLVVTIWDVISSGKCC